MVIAQQDIGPERRTAVRLAGNGPVEVVRIDDSQQPVEVLRGTEILNVSAGGMALVSRTAVSVGSRLSIDSTTQKTGDISGSKIRLETLECSSFEGSLHRIRCKLTGGSIPAAFIYGW